MDEETFRLEVQKIIDNCTNEERKRKLIGLQWKLDQLRVVHKDNPTKLMIEFSSMMMDSVLDLQEKLITLQGKLVDLKNTEE